MQSKVKSENSKGKSQDERELIEAMGAAAASSAGYVPREKESERKRGDKRRREFRDKHAARTALKVRSAAEAMAGESEQGTVNSEQFRKKRALFGELWREGEFVVVVGPSGVGKSVLAMQIGETVARGSAVNSEQGTVNSGEEGLELIEVVDDSGFDHPAPPTTSSPEADATPLQAGGELNPSSPDPGGERDDFGFDALAKVNGNRRVLYIDLERTEAQRVERYSGYGFAEQLEWADVGSFGVMHSKYRGSVTRFLVDSVYEEIRNREPDVVFIDNFTYLLRAGRRHLDLPALMKTLRRMVNDTGISVMLLAHSDSRVGRSKYLDEKNYHVGFELADRVLAVCHSSMDRSFRYVKPVFPAGERSDEVATYQIVSWPFVSFEFVGMMEEAAHLRDYREHARLVRSAVKRVEERWGEQRPRFSAVVPSKFRITGIEAVERES
jgi:hypothetical protein